MRLSPHCVYTMRHSDELTRVGVSGGATYSENKNWKAGAEIFGRASALGERVPIVFSAAERDSGLIFWALLTDVDVQPRAGDDQPQATYAFESLQPIEPALPQSTLRLRAGRPLSDAYIRPYAICETPSFVAKSRLLLRD